MSKEKISILNDEFDLGIALLIIRKNLWYILGLVALGFCVAFFVNRYTSPQYSASGTVKISEKNEVNQMMNFENIYETNLIGELSRLNSKKMLSEALARLNLNVDYFSKGKFLNTENYQSNPFSITYQLKNKSLSNKEIKIKFEDNLAVVSFTKKQLNKKVLPLNKWCSINGIEIKINMSNQKLNELNNSEKLFLFKIADESQNTSYYSKGLQVGIKNQRAKTIMITYTGNHPKKCADIVNSLSSSFLVSNISKKKESANQMIKFTDDQILKINKKLEYYQRLLKPYKDLQKSPNNVDIDYGKLTLNLKSKDQIEKSETQATLLDFRKFYNAIIQRANHDELYSILLLNSNNRYISSVGTKLKSLLSERRSLIFRLTEESYEVKEIDYQIRLEIDDLKDVTKNLIIDLEDNLKSIDNRLESYKIAKKSNEVNFDHNTDYLHLQRMYDINSEYYSKLLTKKAEYEMVRAGFVSDNEIIEPARANPNPISPRKNYNYLLFTGIGFILGLIIVVVKYLLHNTVSSTADIKKYTSNIPILGMVPSYKDEIPVSQLIVDKNPKSLMSEAFRSIRSNLQYIDHNKGAKVLTVTSTISGEGKTFVAINLGGIIAFSEKKVIILDLDMRKPKTHIGFNVQNTIGMSTLLIGRTTLKECTQKSNLQNLDFITAGPIPPNPSELIISQKMTDIIEELKDRYDVIVIDTPPVGIVTDALPIISKVDYPIYIVRANFSKKVFLQNIQVLRDTKNIKNLSIILNGAEGNKKYGGYGKYGYGYGYGYGSGQGYYEEAPQKKEKVLKRIFSKI